MIYNIIIYKDQPTIPPKYNIQGQSTFSSFRRIFHNITTDEINITKYPIKNNLSIFPILKRFNKRSWFFNITHRFNGDLLLNRIKPLLNQVYLYTSLDYLLKNRS